MSVLAGEDDGPTVDPARSAAGEQWAGHWREFPAPWRAADPQSPEQQALAAEVLARVAAAELLPDRQRIVITLRDVEGYGADGCARCSGSPRRTTGAAAPCPGVRARRAGAVLRRGRNEGDDRVTDLSCNEFVELVTEYLDGTLDDDTLARFVDHLSVCDGCEQYLDQFRRTVTTLADLPQAARRARERLLGAFRNAAVMFGRHAGPRCAVSTWPGHRQW